MVDVFGPKPPVAVGHESFGHLPTAVIHGSAGRDLRLRGGACAPKAPAVQGRAAPGQGSCGGEAWAIALVAGRQPEDPSRKKRGRDVDHFQKRAGQPNLALYLLLHDADRQAHPPRRCQRIGDLPPRRPPPGLRAKTMATRQAAQSRPFRFRMRSCPPPLVKMKGIPRSAAVEALRPMSLQLPPAVFNRNGGKRVMVNRSAVRRLRSLVILTHGCRPIRRKDPPAARGNRISARARGRPKASMQPRRLAIQAATGGTRSLRPRSDNWPKTTEARAVARASTPSIAPMSSGQSALWAGEKRFVSSTRCANLGPI
jgi:hypothetical protein